MVQELFTKVERHDGVSPINESGALVIEGKRPGQIYDRQTAAAVADLRDGTIMLAVHPDHRRKGHGTALLREVLAEHPGLTVWAFGSLKGTKKLARKLDLEPRRTLLRMERPLTDADLVDDELSHFEPEDANRIVEINAAAFAHHPEQGKLTREEFDDLREQPWFDANGLRVARDGDLPIGFHWTKEHGNGLGEVYVIAVHPDHEGRGHGRKLLEAGLSHLRRRGNDKVELYVEAADDRVVSMYLAAGFEVAARDTSYGRKG